MSLTLSGFDRGMLISHREDVKTLAAFGTELVKTQMRYEGMRNFAGWLLGAIAVLLVALVWSLMR